MDIILRNFTNKQTRRKEKFLEYHVQDLSFIMKRYKEQNLSSVKSKDYVKKKT